VTIKNTLYYGDNLDVLRRHVESESVDLVYLDPPFNSNADYNVLFGERDGTRAASQIKAFGDTWTWDQEAQANFADAVTMGGSVAQAMMAFKALVPQSDMLAYLSMMAPRLMELRRVLKPTGSIYLHCDPTASHYLKLLLDAVFGPANYLSEVIWKRSSAHNSAKRYGPVHDTILFYAKSSAFKWNPIYQPLPQSTIDAWYNNVEDKTGRLFNRADMTAPGVRTGASGSAWRGIDPTAKGRHWAIPGFVAAVVAGKDTVEALDALDAAGRLYWPKRSGGIPMLKRYLDESKGTPQQDVITDIGPMNNVHAERLGYPTQKPVELIERFLLASSDEGDTVLDPFCGCGTTVAAAQKLGRRWVGIDITHLAVNLIKVRLLDTFGAAAEKAYRVIGEPVDLESARALAEADKYQFQYWALGLVGARPEPSQQKKGADKGIDGRLYITDAGGDVQSVVISVKGGHVTVSQVRDLVGVVQREQAAVGVFICIEEPTKPMRAEAADAGFYQPKYVGAGKHPRVQIITVGELLDGKRLDLPPQAEIRSFKAAPKAKAKGHKQADLF
jgi:DNA modification methylase